MWCGSSLTLISLRRKNRALLKFVRKLPKQATRTQRSWLKRRAAIEPVIDHVKYNYCMVHNHLKEVGGNQVNAALAAAGYNLAKLLSWLGCA